jgi:hypothetical protein
MLFDFFDLIKNLNSGYFVFSFYKGRKLLIIIGNSTENDLFFKAFFDASEQEILFFNVFFSTLQKNYSLKKTKISSINEDYEKIIDFFCDKNKKKQIKIFDIKYLKKDKGQ